MKVLVKIGILLGFTSIFCSFQSVDLPDKQQEPPSALQRKHNLDPILADILKETFRFNYEKKTLSNGLQVFLIEDHSLPIVSYQTWFKVGSIDEAYGSTGMTHMIEHLMFKGTPKYGPRKFYQDLELKGSEINAYTTRDYAYFYENVSADLLGKVIDLEADRMQNIILNDEALNNEKMTAIEEFRLKSEGPLESKMAELVWALAFRYHPYQRPISGYPSDVFSVSLSQLKDYFKSYFQPSNAVLVVTGDFKAASTFSLIKESYEKIPSSPRPKLREIPLEPPSESERRLILRDQVSSEKFLIAYRICNAQSDDSLALDVLANILFQGKSSRGYRRLIEEQDLLTGIAGSSFTPTYPGLFVISGALKGKLHADKAEEQLYQLITEVQQKAVTEIEIQTAVRQLTLQLIDSIRTPYGLAQLFGTVQTIYGDLEGFLSGLSKYTKVNAAAVKEVAEKYFNPNNRVVITLVPK